MNITEAPPFAGLSEAQRVRLAEVMRRTEPAPFPGPRYLTISCTPGWRPIRVEAHQPSEEGPPSHIEVCHALLGVLEAVRRSARRRRRGVEAVRGSWYWPLARLCAGCWPAETA